MGIKKLTPTSPARRYQTYLTNDELTTSEAVQAAAGEQDSGPVAATISATSRCAIAAAGTSATTGSSISSATRPAFRPRSRPSNTIRIARRESRWSTTPMARSVTSSRRPDSRSGRRSSPVLRRTSSPGNALPIKNIPLGTQIHNIELKPGKGGQMARSAGSFAQLVAKEGETAQLRLPSGEIRLVSVDCMATVGQVGNAEHENVSIGKAGRTRWMGKRPTVRGVAMNPVDHPHGGGEGKTSGGRNPVTPWGQPTRGYKTRNNKRTDKFIVKRRTK